MLDYSKFYSLERYLFDEAGRKFARSGTIDPIDFYLIVIWKANRAKTRVKDRLVSKGGSFSEAVSAISSQLANAPTSETKLGILMEQWGFRLPMASAILTVLYPTEFTVYDIRVCDELKDFHNLAWQSFSDKLWASYERFVEAVRMAVPEHALLRDKDRYLWGRSLYKSVQEDLQNC